MKFYKKPRKTKYQQGPVIRDIHHLIALIQANRYVYWGKTPKHPSVLISMTFRTLSGCVKAGIIREAIPTEIEVPF